MPRAIKWAIVAAALVVGFFIYEALVLQPAAAWSAKAADIERDVAAARATNSNTMSVVRLKDPIEALGEVELPAKPSESREALQRTVNDVVKKHKVSEVFFDTRGQTSLPRGVLEGVISTTERAEAISGELRFEATQDVIAAVIRDLESSPEIEAVTTVRLNKPAGRVSGQKLNVSLMLEAWVRAPKNTPAGTRS